MSDDATTTKPKPGYKGPTIKIRPQTQRVEEGKRTDLYCKLGEDPLSVQWILDDEVLKDGGDNGRFKVWNDGGECFCQILVTRAVDGGLYVFKARNKRGECCTTFTLHVQPAVKPLSDVDVRELLWDNTQQNQNIV